MVLQVSAELSCIFNPQQWGESGSEALLMLPGLLLIYGTSARTRELTHL